MRYCGSFRKCKEDTRVSFHLSPFIVVLITSTPWEQDQHAEKVSRMWLSWWEFRGNCTNVSTRRERSDALFLPLHPDGHPMPIRVDSAETDPAMDHQQLQFARSQSSVNALVFPGGLSSDIKDLGVR